MQYRILGENKKFKDGRLVVKFRYWENGKLKTIPSKLLPAFYSEAEILNKLPALEGKYDREKMRNQKIEDWKNKYFDFVELVKKYESWIIERKARRSYKSKMIYLNNYVLPYFLGIRGQNNMNCWSDFFDDFQKHLKTINCKNHKDKKLKENTINHIINELNCFLGRMHTLGKCVLQPKCETIPDAKEKSIKGIEYVFTDQEAEEFYTFLFNINEVHADAFWLLLKTGMRISEFRGIGPDNLKIGKIPNLDLQRTLASSGLDNYRCFIFFNSQVSEKSRIRKKNKIEFIPLKSKRKISEDHTRFVPIYDQRSEAIINKYMKISHEKIVKNLYTNNYSQYAFFYDSISGTILNKQLAKFYSKNENKNYTKKSCHDCRHSYATWLGMHDFTFKLQKLILGHHEEAAKRYCHTLGKMLNEVREGRKNPLDSWDFNFVKVDIK